MHLGFSRAWVWPFESIISVYVLNTSVVSRLARCLGLVLFSQRPGDSMQEEGRDSSSFYTFLN